MNTKNTNTRDRFASLAAYWRKDAGHYFGARRQWRMDRANRYHAVATFWNGYR